MRYSCSPEKSLTNFTFTSQTLIEIPTLYSYEKVFFQSHIELHVLRFSFNQFEKFFDPLKQFKQFL